MIDVVYLRIATRSVGYCSKTRSSGGKREAQKATRSINYHSNAPSANQSVAVWPSFHHCWPPLAGHPRAPRQDNCCHMLAVNAKNYRAFNYKLANHSARLVNRRQYCSKVGAILRSMKYTLSSDWSENWLMYFNSKCCVGKGKQVAPPQTFPRHGISVDQNF